MNQVQRDFRMNHNFGTVFQVPSIFTYPTIQWEEDLSGIDECLQASLRVSVYLVSTNIALHGMYLTDAYRVVFSILRLASDGSKLRLFRRPAQAFLSVDDVTRWLGSSAVFNEYCNRLWRTNEKCAASETQLHVLLNKITATAQQILEKYYQHDLNERTRVFNEFLKNQP